MFFVCLAHFANSYQIISGASEAGGYLVIAGMVASPTFEGLRWIFRRRVHAVDDVLIDEAATLHDVGNVRLEDLCGPRG